MGVATCAQDLEKALSKRELIAMKGRATVARAKTTQGKATSGEAGSVTDAAAQR